MSKRPFVPDPVAAREFALEVARRLRAAGHQSVWAGGCVRDQLLGRTPKDYDVATDARPERVREVFGKKRTLAIGAAFGVITVHGPKQAGPIEVATFRRDLDYSDGRRPDGVEYCDAREDALRRDFTINGLFFDPLEERVLDFVGGQEDLRRGLIRAIGDPEQRIAEDKLRMLRAVRFASTFGFSICAETFASVQRHADEIVAVSPERIGAEMQRMLSHEHRATAARLLAESNLLAATTQVLQPRRSTEQSGLLWPIALRAMAALPKAPAHPDAAAAALAALLVAWAPSPEAIQRQIQAWRLPHRLGLLARLAVEHFATVTSASQSPWSKVQPILSDEAAEVWVAFAEAWSNAGGADPTQDHAEACRAVNASLKFCWSRLRGPRSVLAPEPLLTGSDLIQQGLQPGPRFKSLLQEIRDQQLDGLLTSPEEALQWLQSRGLGESASQ